MRGRKSFAAGKSERERKGVVSLLLIFRGRAHSLALSLARSLSVGVLTHSLLFGGVSLSSRLASVVVVCVVRARVCEGDGRGGGV